MMKEEAHSSKLKSMFQFVYSGLFSFVVNRPKFDHYSVTSIILVHVVSGCDARNWLLALKATTLF